MFHHSILKDSCEPSVLVLQRESLPSGGQEVLDIRLHASSKKCMSGEVLQNLVSHRRNMA